MRFVFGSSVAIAHSLRALTSPMIDLRRLARDVLAQSDAELAADCLWSPTPSGLSLVHQRTGFQIEVAHRRTPTLTRAVALVQLRNRCYDVLGFRGGRPRQPPKPASNRRRRT